MIEIIEIENGLGIYQNNSERRFIHEEWLELLKILKRKFKNQFFKDLYGEQSGYFFYTSKSELSKTINDFTLASLSA